MDNSLGKWTKNKRETQITKLRNKSGDIPTDFTELERFVRVLWTVTCQQCGTSDEMGTFLESQNPARLNHEEIENRTRLVTNKEMESVIKNLMAKQSLGSDGFTRDSVS